MQTTINKKRHLSNAADLMPHTELADKILRLRAERLAVRETDQIDVKSLVNYIHFRLNNEHYGIPYTCATEVMHNVVITKVPCAPDYIAGVINRRGALIAVIDLKQFFNIKTTTSSQEKQSIIIVGNEGMTAGFIVDYIEGSKLYNKQTLDNAIPSQGVKKTEYILGIHDGLTTIINVESIMLDTQQKTVNE